MIDLMSQKDSTSGSKEEPAQPVCRGRLVVDVEGRWWFKLEEGSPCAGTVLSIADKIGPAAARFLAKHLEAGDQATGELVKRLESGKKPLD